MRIGVDLGGTKIEAIALSNSGEELYRERIETPKDNYSSRHKSTPDHEKGAEEIVTMHEKMYRMATAKYNPFAIGGSESIQDFQGGSENVHDK